MASTACDNLQRQEILVKKFLAGERESDILCITNAILDKKFPEIKLKKRENVDRILGLYVFVIKRR